MKDFGFGQPIASNLPHPIPCRLVSLAMLSERAPPERRDVEMKCPERREICRHCVVGEISSDDLPQPFPLFGDGLAASSRQRLLDLSKPGSQAVAAGLSLEKKFASHRLSANKRRPRRRRASPRP